MFLKGDVTTIVQKWGSMPRHAGSKMGPAPIGNFLPESFQPRLIQGRKIKHGFLHFYRAGETTQDEVEAYRSGNNDQLRVKRIIIQ